MPNLFLKTSTNIKPLTSMEVNYEISHGSQNVLGVLTWIGGY
jgi:hypothetical protein